MLAVNTREPDIDTFAWVHLPRQRQEYPWQPQLLFKNYAKRHKIQSFKVHKKWSISKAILLLEMIDATNTCFLGDFLLQLAQHPYSNLSCCPNLPCNTGKSSVIGSTSKMIHLSVFCCQEGPIKPNLCFGVIFATNYENT